MARMLGAASVPDGGTEAREKEKSLGNFTWNNQPGEKSRHRERSAGKRHIDPDCPSLHTRPAAPGFRRLALATLGVAVRSLRVVRR